MTARVRRLIALVATFALALALAAPAGAAQGSEAMDPKGRVSPAVDALFLRPLGFVSLVGGTVLFVASVPIVLITRPHEIHRPFKQLVLAPAKYTWADPLGSH